MKNLTPSETETLKMFDDFRQKAGYGFSDGDTDEDIKSFLLTQLRLARATTLSTLVKEMEGLKIGASRRLDPWSASVSGIENQASYNQGISAAIDVVNRLMK